MTHSFALVILVLAPLAAATQSDQQPKRRHTQKEVRAQMRADERGTAARIQAKLDDYIKIATNRGENPYRRGSTLETLGHSQDLRAAKVLRDYADDENAAVADGALSGLRTMTMALDDNPVILGQVKKLIDDKIKKIAKEGSRDANQGGSTLVDLLNNVGDEDTVCQAGRVSRARKAVAETMFARNSTGRLARRQSSAFMPGSERSDSRV